MRVRIIASAWLLAVGLYSGGCVAIDDNATEPSESTAESETIVWCSHKAWRVDFYAEPALINVVGWLKCNCWQPQTSSGTTSNYLNLAYEIECGGLE